MLHWLYAILVCIFTIGLAAIIRCSWAIYMVNKLFKVAEAEGGPTPWFMDIDFTHEMLKPANIFMWRTDTWVKYLKGLVLTKGEK